MDLTQTHKSRKQNAYWENLVQGETGRYKARVIDELIALHGPAAVDSLLDIGCGTSEIALHFLESLSARRLVGLDYDAAVVEAAATRYTEPRLVWRTADIFELDRCADRFQLVFLLDMLHEVYSFYGRPNRDLAEPIDHALGQDAVARALTKVAQVVSSGGGVIITDNVLCPDDVRVAVRIRNPAARDAVRVFLADYPSRRMAHGWRDENTLELGAHDFCVLLTQYNKIKRGDSTRWNVEKLETHQYMTLAEFERCFTGLGFTLHPVIGTPAEAAEEWNADFAMVEGLSAIPEKRISLLAVKTA